MFKMTSTPRIVTAVLYFSAIIFSACCNKSKPIKESSMNSVSSAPDFFLFDFTTLADLHDWEEQSDTVRKVGMSKAIIILQKTQVFQRAVFFTLLNPQPNNAGFAGVRKQTTFDLRGYNNLELRSRGQGDCEEYKIVLRHKNLNDEPYPTYEQFFTSTKEFSVLKLPLSEFKPYYRGKQLNETEVGPLDTGHITSFGLQVYGGVYSDVKQHGASSFEIDYIKAI